MFRGWLGLDSAIQKVAAEFASATRVADELDIVIGRNRAALTA